MFQWYILVRILWHGMKTLIMFFFFGWRSQFLFPLLLCLKHAQLPTDQLKSSFCLSYLVGNQWMRFYNYLEITTSFQRYWRKNQTLLVSFFLHQNQEKVYFLLFCAHMYGIYIYIYIYRYIRYSSLAYKALLSCPNWALY